MVGVNAVSGAIANIAPTAKSQLPASSPFGGMLKSLVEQTGELDRKAQQTVTGMLSGQGVEVHEAMIATQKADMAFELALQVRNKAVGAYQQMMAMQF
jgi:flagellar hook-basal body complex protein FliE